MKLIHEGFDLPPLICPLFCPLAFVLCPSAGAPPPDIILASASPRRAALLEAAGLTFRRQASDINEDAIQSSGHREYAMLSALAKSREIARRSDNSAIVIGADTIVCLGSRRLGKPGSPAEARDMLRGLESGRHEVMTGIALCRGGEELVRDCVATSVWFSAIPEPELEAYLSTAEPYDKAGAYAIQGWAAAYIERIEGDWHNVVGLPLRRLIEALSDFTDTSALRVPNQAECIRIMAEQ